MQVGGLGAGVRGAGEMGRLVYWYIGKLGNWCNGEMVGVVVAGSKGSID